MPNLYQTAKPVEVSPARCSVLHCFLLLYSLYCMIHVQCRSRGNAHTGCAQHYPTALDRITEGSQAKALILFCFLTQWVVNCSTASHLSLPPCSPGHPLETKPETPVMDTWSVGPQSTSPWPLGPQQKVSSLNILSSSTTFRHSLGLCKTSSFYLFPSRIMTPGSLHKTCVVCLGILRYPVLACKINIIITM